MTTPATLRFANTLKNLRVEAGYTQISVAEAVDISVRYYQELEAGAKTPALITVVQLAKAFGVPSAVLLEGVDSLVTLPNPKALKRGDRRKTKKRRELK